MKKSNTTLNQVLNSAEKLIETCSCCGLDTDKVLEKDDGSDICHKCFVENRVNGGSMEVESYPAILDQHISKLKKRYAKVLSEGRYVAF